jgi:hypothetical protein
MQPDRVHETLIAALENLTLGEPWAGLLATAESALAAARAEAEAEVFPTTLAPTTADAIAEYTWRTSRLPAAGYGTSLAQIHRRAVVDHPELARLLRSQDALDDVGAAAAQLAYPGPGETHAVAGARAAAIACAEYKLAIGRHVAETETGAAPAARALVAVADDLAIRLAAAKARHQEHARAEIERADLEARAVARAVVDRTVQRVREAEARAADAHEKAAVSAQEYQRIKADALIERLRLSGLGQLNVGSREIYYVADLISTARDMTVELLARYEAALAAHEAR